MSNNTGNSTAFQKLSEIYDATPQTHTVERYNLIEAFGDLGGIQAVQKLEDIYRST